MIRYAIMPDIALNCGGPSIRELARDRRLSDAGYQSGNFLTFQSSNEPIPVGCYSEECG